MNEHLNVSEEKEEKSYFYCMKNAKKSELNEKKAYISANIIYKDILARETKIDNYTSEQLISSGNNELTFQQMRKLLEKEFNTKTLAEKMYETFENLINGEKK